MGDTKESHGISQFNGSGFDDWQFRVKLYLDSLGLLHVLTGVPPNNAQELETFMRNDKKAKDRLVAFIHSDCLCYVREKNTAKEMWESLQSVFAKKSLVNQLLLRKKLSRLRMNDGDNIIAHVMAFENLIRQLKMAGATIDDSDLLAQFFLTLPEKFDPLVTALQNVEDGKLTFNLVKERLMSEEAKLSDRNQEEVEQKTAFVGKKFNKSKKFNGKCFKCNKFGHKACDCKKSDARVAQNKSVCFMVGSNVKESSYKTEKQITFKLDSGASDHMTNQKWCFDSMRELEEPVEISVAKNKEFITAKECGEIKGLSNKDVVVTMKNVLYAPDLRDNLLSVRKLTNADIEVKFTHDKAFILKDKEVIAIANLCGNLYELTINIKSPTAQLCSSDNIVLWHRRLGHIGESGLRNMEKANLLTGLNLKSNSLGFCDVCVEGKQCREPFDDSRVRGKRVLERIHSDVCGPIDPIAWNGAKYFVSFIDDYTHFAMIYVIKKKSDVFKAFQEYEALVTSMFNGNKISKLTIDQGREYLSTEQSKWYKSKGIQIEPTIAYSPQQNGVAERFNRTITEKVRTMLLQSGASKMMWSEAALTAVYILNRCPTRCLENLMTPAEMWLGVKPNLDKVKVFGCKAYAWVPNQCRKKLDPKSKMQVMIGYAPNGYRLWDMEKKKVITARDVKFDENDFPFAHVKNSNSSDVIVIQRSYEQEGEENECDQAVPIPATVNMRNLNDPNNEISTSDVLPNMDESINENEVVDNETIDLTEDEDEISPEEAVAVRRSNRERHLPRKLLNYITGLESCVTNKVIPEKYNDIKSLEDADKWMKAVADELKSMEKNQVWNIVESPKGAKLLTSKWVFCIKTDENGNPTKYKARLVARGFQQKQGVDFFETYAPVAKLTTIRVVLAVGLYRKYIFHQLDVKTAFLHGDLQEDVYMKIPEGVEASERMACKLNKSLYGLKQAPRCWNTKFNNFLLSLGFKRSKRDYCLYTKLSQNHDDDIVIIMYVDDLLIGGNKLTAIEKLKKDLSKRFEMSDCGILKHFLGMKIQHNGEKILISQETNVNKLLAKFGMSECNSVATPMEKGLQLQHNSGSECKQPYRELLGSLMYVMLCSRPDICYPVGYMGRYQQNPNETHWQHLKRVVRYLKGTLTNKLNFQITNDEPIVGYVDADWASDVADRKSVSGYIFKIFGCTVSWCSKKQQTVAKSSSEAEYIALSLATTEAIWLQGVLNDLDIIPEDKPVILYEDNRGCIGMATNLESKRARHIDITHHFVRDSVANNKIKIEYIRTNDQLADIFTKATDTASFKKFRHQLGISD